MTFAHDRDPVLVDPFDLFDLIDQGREIADFAFRRRVLESVGDLFAISGRAWQRGLNHREPGRGQRLRGHGKRLQARLIGVVAEKNHGGNRSSLLTDAIHQRAGLAAVDVYSACDGCANERLTFQATAAGKIVRSASVLAS